MNISTIVLADPLAKYLGEWALTLSWQSVCLRLALAFVFATIIGLERASKRHSAGLRTFILVTLACALAVMTDAFLSLTLGMRFSLISAAALIGIAIISTSSVLYSSRSQIKGLTTAVGLWASAVLGLCVGAGFYTASAVGFVMLLCILTSLQPLEIYLKNRSNHFEIHLEMKDRRSLAEFVLTIRRLGLRIDDIEFNPAYAASGLSVFSVALTIEAQELKKYKTHKEIITALSTLPYISFVEEMK